MPKATTDAVIWQEDASRYEWHRRGDSNPYPLYAEDEPAFIQPGNSSSLAFQGKHGHLTLRKESRAHGAGYWYAYRTQGHRTLKKYVGRTANLTIARLEDIAEALSAEVHLSSDERSQAKGEDIPAQHAASPVEERHADFQGRISVPASATAPWQKTPLLTAKLRPPRLHASLVTRSRLLTMLDAGLEHKLTLLSAPAGFGKTTLASQWVANRMASGSEQQDLRMQPEMSFFAASSAHLADRQSTPAVAWISLDPDDNDPVRFWSYVITACQIFQEGIGRDALALLHTAQHSPFEPPPLEAALTIFLNELSHLLSREILILEDYHVITSPRIQELMAFVLDHLPATLHLVMMTRVDPPLPLARLRAHRDLYELHTTDLRFSQEETRTFLQRAMPFPLSSEVITQLDTRMEGWVTGLHLVALALQGRMTQQEVEQYLSTFSGNYRHVLEFFVTEVLDAQAEPLQTFLLQTSVLSRLNGSLCAAVTGRDDSERLLAAVERANLFLQPFDEAGQWYRYHSLFAEAMQHEALRRLGEEALRECSGRASVWYEQHDMFTEAVEAALQARMFERATDLMEQFIESRHLREHHILRRWISAVPEEILGQYPKLCLHFARLLLFSPDFRVLGLLAPIERLLHMAERAWQAEENRSGLAEILAFRALMAVRLQGDLVQAARLAGQALAWLPESEQHWRAMCLRFIGIGEFLSGKLHEARQLFMDSQALFVAIGNGYAARAGLFALGDVCSLQGELHQAAELYRAVLDSAGVDLSSKGKALLGLARLSYEWNDLDKAEQEAQEAVDLGTRSANEGLQMQASLALVDIEHARGQTERARQMLHALLARIQKASQQQPAQLYQEIFVKQARLQLAAGDLAAVERWSSTRATCKQSVPRLQQEQEDLIVSRLLMAQREPGAALRLLERWQAEAHQHGRMRSEMEMLVLIALAYFAQQRQSQARQRLREALLLAHTEGYLRLFLDEGEEMTALLRAVLPTLRKELPATYVRTLLHAFAQRQLAQVVSSTAFPVSAPLVEPLSPQEQRVLRLLAAGFSNPDIAEAMVVSVNTVKTQVQSIYRKLNVRNRKEAREAVQSQNLL